MFYKTWKCFGVNRTKAKADRTEQRIAIKQRGIGLPQISVKSCLQTNLGYIYGNSFCGEVKGKSGKKDFLR